MNFEHFQTGNFNGSSEPFLHLKCPQCAFLCFSSCLLLLPHHPAPSCPPVSQPHTSLAAITRWPHSRYLGAYMHFYVLILDNLRIWCSGFLYNLCVSNILVTRNHSNNLLVHCCEALMVLFTLEQALIDAPISKADKPLTKSDSCFMNAELNK